jgi:hypothetical protein
MQQLTIEQFRATVEAGGVLSVSLVAQGPAFTIHAETHRGEAVLIDTRKKQPRQFMDPRKALLLLREFGMKDTRMDINAWRPEQMDTVRRSRPDRREAMKDVVAALEHDRWFRQQIDTGLDEMRQAKTHTHDQVAHAWSEKRSEIVGHLADSADATH